MDELKVRIYLGFCHLTDVIDNGSECGSLATISVCPLIQMRHSYGKPDCNWTELWKGTWLPNNWQDMPKWTV